MKRTCRRSRTPQASQARASRACGCWLGEDFGWSVVPPPCMTRVDTKKGPKEVVLGGRMVQNLLFISLDGSTWVSGQVWVDLFGLNLLGWNRALGRVLFPWTSHPRHRPLTVFLFFHSHMTWGRRWPLSGLGSCGFAWQPNLRLGSDYGQGWWGKQERLKLTKSMITRKLRLARAQVGARDWGWRRRDNIRLRLWSRSRTRWRMAVKCSVVNDEAVTGQFYR